MALATAEITDDDLDDTLTLDIGIDEVMTDVDTDDIALADPDDVNEADAGPVEGRVTVIFGRVTGFSRASAH